jgi:hypothetical protein
MEFDLDLTDVQNEDQMEAGDRLPVGWYKATLTDFYDDHNKEGSSVFEWTVDGGVFDGQKTWDRCTDPASLDDPAKQKTALKRIKLLANRLGLVKKEDFGKPGVHVNFADAINAAMVLEVQEWSNKDNPSKKGTSIAFDGVYPPDHEKIPADVRQRLGLPPARKKDESEGGAAGAAAPNATGNNSPKKPADDFSDL